MISLAEIVNDPDFAQSFTVERSSGSFDDTGTFVSTPADVPFYGIIQPATAKEIEAVPEGDRKREVKSLHSSQEFFLTRNDPSKGISDIAIWPATGERYKLVKLYPWIDFGYYKALGVRMAGD